MTYQIHRPIISLFLLSFLLGLASFGQSPFGKKGRAQESAREKMRESVRAPEVIPPPRRQTAPVAQPKPQRVRPTYVPMQEFGDGPTAQRFLDLAYRKQVTEEDISVLSRLQEEKKTEFQKMNEQLASEFGMDAESEYEYDASTRELSMKPVAEGGELKLITTLAEKSREDLFLRLIAAKRLTSNALATLELLLLEKEKEVQLVDNKLLADYNVHEEKDYYYDAERRSLFLIVEPGK